MLVKEYITIYECYTCSGTYNVHVMLKKKHCADTLREKIEVKTNKTNTILCENVHMIQPLCKRERLSLFALHFWHDSLHIERKIQKKKKHEKSGYTRRSNFKLQKHNLYGYTNGKIEIVFHDILNGKMVIEQRKSQNKTKRK